MGLIRRNGKLFVHAITSEADCHLVSETISQLSRRMRMTLSEPMNQPLQPTIDLTSVNFANKLCGQREKKITRITDGLLTPPPPP